MISMIEKNRILISYYREGKTISDISRLLKISRTTIRKYIREHESCFSSNNRSSIEALSLGISTKPAYDTSNRTRLKLSDKIISEIDLCLLENIKKRNSGLHKQQMKKIDIYEHLLSKNYDISYSTVCNYIREKENKSKECFIKQVYSPGELSEFDWADVKLNISGTLLTVNLGIFTSAFSNHRYGKLFYRQDSLAFGQMHIDYISEIGGVPKELVYDNMRVAVRKFVGYSIKEPTEALLELSNYYKFNFRFCNIAKGNEKGHVERSVEFVRRKAFSKNISFSSLEEANAHLLKTLEILNNTGQQLSGGKTANELFESEKPHLYKAPIPYKCFKEEYSKADKYSTVILYGNRYSVPDFFVNKLVRIKVFAEKLDMYYNNEFLCSHRRSYAAHSWVINIEHYLTTLLKKPGALKNSLALNQVEEGVKRLYFDYFLHESKDFIELLQYCKDYEVCWSEVEKATKRLSKISPLDMNKDKILLLISKERDVEKMDYSNDEIYKYSKILLNELSEKYN